MPDFLLLDPGRAGSLFIPTIVATPAFQAPGIAYGRGRDCWWAVVDPRSHPFYLWRSID